MIIHTHTHIHFRWKTVILEPVFSCFAFLSLVI
jgi:hypothetical protein